MIISASQFGNSARITRVLPNLPVDPLGTAGSLESGTGEVTRLGRAGSMARSPAGQSARLATVFPRYGNPFACLARQHSASGQVRWTSPGPGGTRAKLLTSADRRRTITALQRLAGHAGDERGL